MMKDDQAVAALTALAHGDRLATYRLLVGAGPSGMASGAIARALAIAPTRMSFHLSALERSGLLRSWRDGRRVLYAVDLERMRRLLVFLTEDCCGGNPTVCGDFGRLAAAMGADPEKR